MIVNMQEGLKKGKKSKATEEAISVATKFRESTSDRLKSIGRQAVHSLSNQVSHVVVLIHYSILVTSFEPVPCKHSTAHLLPTSLCLLLDIRLRAPLRRLAVIMHQPIFLLVLPIARQP